jgi:hypothetical protein
MKVRLPADDDSGVNFVLEYVLTFMIASVIFSIMLVMANGLFIQGPKTTVSEVQFTDIGNDLSAKIMDTYLVAPVSPDSGNVSTVFDIPSSIAGSQYFVNVVPSGTDRIVSVYSNSSGVMVNVTLNSVNSTIPVSGSTSSGSISHRIWYNSTE